MNVNELIPHNGSTYNTAVQSQKAVSAYFSSKQILLFGFAEQNMWRNNVSVNLYMWLTSHPVPKGELDFQLVPKSQLCYWRNFYL